MRGLVDIQMARLMKILGFWFLLSTALLLTAGANAQTYNLSAGQYPPCNTSWSVSGTTYTCTGNGRVTLPSGAVIVANASSLIVADNGFSLNNNTLGSASATVSLRSNYGSIDAQGNTTINGNINATSSQVNLTSTNVTGAITTGGHVVLTGGSVSGQVTSTDNTITTNGTNLQNGALARSGMSITGGVVAGNFVMTQNNPITLSGVTMTSGSISGASTVTITGGSTLGSSGSSINVSSTSGPVTVTNNSTVYGVLTAPSWSTINVNNGGSVFGSCIPNSTPANACSAAPTLLGSWRMDEAFWNGTPNEVADSSGNNYHGRARIAAGSTPTATTAQTSPAFTSGNQSTCGYGQFDSVTAPVRTFTYVELTGFPSLSSNFSFTGWIRSTNASAQHQRILVRDDGQNGWGLSLAAGTGEPRLRFFNRNIQNSGSVSGQGRNPNCGSFCLDTNPVITSNTWYFIAATVDTSARVITLYVYNQSGNLLARTSSAYSGNWQDGSGSLAVGGETLASAEGIQSAFHFLGNIDEPEIYSGVLSQSYIESLRTRVRSCPVIGPQYYELKVPEASIGCMATPVTITACADNSSPCTNSFAGVAGTSASLSTSAGSLASTQVSFNSAGIATTTLTHAAVTNATPVTVSLISEEIPGINPRRCCQGNNCSVSNSCITTFNSAGLAFVTADAPNVASIPHQVAGVTDSSVRLRAVRSNSSTGACEARVTGQRNVQLAFECLNPATCINGQVFNAASMQVQANNNNAALAFSNVSLLFDNTGTAAMPIDYSDVGQLRLHARLPIPASPPEPAFTLSGSSNDFVVKPHSLVVTQVAGNPGTTSGGTGFKAAGEAFGVEIQARNANQQVAPNFGREAMSQATGIRVDLDSLVYPAGGFGGEVAQDGPFVLAAQAGTLTNTAIRWSEVGSIRLVPRLAGNDYLGAGDLAALTPSSTIGRFYPEEFVLTSAQITDACSGFSYMGQPFDVSYRIEARNLQANVTANYQPPYANRAVPVYSAEDTDSGVDLGSRLQLQDIDWSEGVLEMNTDLAVFNRAVSTQPGGPMNNLQFGINLQGDADNRQLSGKNMNPSTTGACMGNACSATSLGTARVLRFGRLRLDDAFGPETVSLPVNFATEYWSNGAWLVSASDSCTAIPRSAISYVPTGPISVDANRTVPLGAGATQGNYANLQPTDVVFSNGNAGHFFTAPSPGAGSFQVKVDLTSTPWLRFDWNQDGNHNNDSELPAANIGFGQYRGHDRIIYWREVLEN